MTALRRRQLPCAALRAAQPFTTLHFSNDQGLEIQSSFILKEDSTLEIGEAMPRATCQNHSSPCCHASSREVSNYSSVTTSMPPHAGMAPLPRSLPHPTCRLPEEDFCAQISLWSLSTYTHHYPNTHCNPFCKTRNKGKYSSSSVKLVHRHNQAKEMYKWFVSLLKKTHTFSETQILLKIHFFVS